MTLMSMTGHADRTGETGGVSWTWEARSVNGRGLDLRLRLPEGAEALDPLVRQAFGAVLSRGNVTVTLRLGRRDAGSMVRLNPEALAAALQAARTAAAAAQEAGLALAPMNAADLLGLRGVLEVEMDPAAMQEEVQAALAAAAAELAAALVESRREEGAALATILLGQLHRMAELVAAARSAAEARAGRTGVLLRHRVEALLEATGGVPDEARLAQELALLAVKADVSEELDRLDAHVAAGISLVKGGGTVGRRLDFLMQEFNREANTLASKAQSSELTSVALEMKVVIDQMREQVQNVE